ncbi:type II CRISPR-associated endonuclease Cas1 [Prosthecodimorpha hirschii]|uniref:type II CRISPR-associated endonuclease Cas1 n=1 Tax=Prosthecodimorpha hirschii TaxID=665126 RepID=UPI0015E2DC24|nr:type II CRISPR-associated endonuclease Cas1 [Prosthecomicrobium hirschii]
MLKKTVEIATPGTRLSVKSRQLVIERSGLPAASLPIEDIGVVIVDDTRAIYTHAVFISLLEAGATVMVSGTDYLPAGMMLPIDAHHVQTERHRAQVDASEPTRKRAWQAIIKSKIRNQAEVLKAFAGEDAGLAAMANRVRSGDPDNLEAQAAQRYWPRLFGKSFRRDRGADGLNGLLNYGYAVIRAATARAIVAAGLIPSLGVFHRNRSNPFCLADDLMEAYRPHVDWRVRKSLDEGVEESRGLAERQTRQAMLSLFNETIMVAGRRWPLLLGIQTSATSLAAVLTGEKAKLALPEGLPLALSVGNEAEEEEG